MRLLFRQRFFSWFDSYDIYDEAGNTVYIVEGKLSWGHRLEIYDAGHNHLGTVKEEVLTFLPRFALYQGEAYIGAIKKEFSLFTPRFTLDCQGWQVTDAGGGFIMSASKELFHLTDTYVIDVPDLGNALLALMIVLAIDAAKCSGDS